MVFTFRMVERLRLSKMNSQTYYFRGLLRIRLPKKVNLQKNKFIDYEKEKGITSFNVDGNDVTNGKRL